MIREGILKLKQNRWVIIFPEGTRVAVGEHKRLGKGGAALAQASGFPIVPIRHNAGVFWPRGFLIKKAGCIQVKIGPLVYPQNKSMHDINAEVESWIKAQE